MTQHLVPTAIVDKNGRLTTVHRRAASSVPKPSDFPSPVPRLAERSKQEIIPGIIDELNELKMIDAGDVEYLTEKLDEYTLDFLVRAEAALQESPEMSSLVGLLIESGADEFHINEAIRFFPEMESRDFWDALRLIKTLHGYYPSLPEEDDYSKASPAVQSQCSALLKVTSAVRLSTRDERGTMRMISVGDKNFDRVAILNDERMIALVLDNPEQAERIIEIITDRGSAEFGMVHAVLHAESLALASGTL